MRMWERESPQHNFVFIVSFSELLHMILFEEKILLGEKKKGREKGREEAFKRGVFSIDFQQGVVLYQIQINW